MKIAFKILAFMVLAILAFPAAEFFDALLAEFGIQKGSPYGAMWSFFVVALFVAMFSRKPSPPTT